MEVFFVKVENWYDNLNNCIYVVQAVTEEEAEEIAARAHRSRISGLDYDHDRDHFHVATLDTRSAEYNMRRWDLPIFNGNVWGKPAQAYAYFAELSDADGMNLRFETFAVLKAHIDTLTQRTFKNREWFCNLDSVQSKLEQVARRRTETRYLSPTLIVRIDGVNVFAWASKR